MLGLCSNVNTTTRTFLITNFCLFAGVRTGSAEPGERRRSEELRGTVDDTEATEVLQELINEQAGTEIPFVQDAMTLQTVCEHGLEAHISDIEETCVNA